MQLRQAVLRTTALYAIFAGLWIIFSDSILDAIVPKESVAPLQTTKGLAFVAITSVMLYSLIKSQIKSTFSSESQLRAVFNSIADAILIVDADLTISNANEAAILLFGYSHDEKVKILRPLRDIAKEFDIRNGTGQPLREEEYASFRALQGYTIRSMQAILQIPGGRKLEVDISAAPIYSNTAGIRGAVMVLRDVSEIRRLQHLRDEFLSTAAHEFKTPLAVIKANAQLLQSAANRWPEEKKNFALRMIDRQCQKANRLVQDLLMGSRMDRANQQLQKTHFNMVDLANDLIQGLQDMTPRHRLVLHPPQNIRTTFVDADRSRIEQVMLNLLDNAIKYSPAGGEVKISIYREGPRIWTSVQDPGIGIRKEKQEQIFEKYYSAHTATPHDFGGMGIGLNLSRETILRHGGKIEFESTENKGSTFRFSLPFAEEVTHEKSA